jgi:hypothetical protein
MWTLAQIRSVGAHSKQHNEYINDDELRQTHIDSDRN